MGELTKLRFELPEGEMLSASVWNRQIDLTSRIGDQVWAGWNAADAAIVSPPSLPGKLDSREAALTSTWTPLLLLYCSVRRVVSAGYRQRECDLDTVSADGAAAAPVMTREDVGMKELSLWKGRATMDSGDTFRVGPLQSPSMPRQSSTISPAAAAPPKPASSQ